MAKHLVTTRESGFSNLAATTSYGDSWADEPSVSRRLWEIEIPDTYVHEADQDGTVIFVNPNDRFDYLVVSGSERKGMSALDRHYRMVSVKARRIDHDPITGERVNTDPA